MSAQRFAPCLQDVADLAVEAVAFREAVDQEAEEEEEGVAFCHINSEGRFDMGESSKRVVDERRRPERHSERRHSEKPHKRSNSDDVERPKSSKRKSGTADKLILSRSKGASAVVRRISAAREPEVEADDSTGAVDSGVDEEDSRSPRTRAESVTISRPDASAQKSGDSPSPRGSGSTIAQIAPGRQGEDENTGATGSKQPQLEKADKRRKPDVLSFLDQDSPAVTEDRIKRTVVAACGEWSPQSASSSAGDDSNSQPSTVDTDATTPDHSINGDSVSTTAVKSSSVLGDDDPTDIKHATQTRVAHGRQQPVRSETNAEAQAHRYGTPQMARGSVKHPHIPPSELQPRLANPGQGHPKHLPRAEKLPMTGYELLAAKLSNSSHRQRRGGSSAGSSCSDSPEAGIKPIYRRFEALNHRMLLHLQDELSELEEQLHRLDTADTQNRRLQNCILPASRRAEFMAGGELQWHKTDILGKIGFKLTQYNHVLSSFTETQNLSRASMSDIEDYRTYLATHSPIAEIETRFLDPAEDLVCLAANRSPGSSYSDMPFSPFPPSDDALTPMPRKMSLGSERSSSPGLPREGIESVAVAQGEGIESVAVAQGEGIESVAVAQREARDGGAVDASLRSIASSADSHRLGQAAGLAAIAVVIPVLAFPVITDFVGRMAVVLVAGLAVAALRRKLAEAGFWIGSRQVLRASDLLTVVGVYGSVMVVVAALL
ncbi:hypothetical protein QBC46DRAFT_389014 [Diplogelasinospora grovesii]|uniref:DUF6594 domain-containing protein n=1 Tax=Diplogelasinospora grovesii TaxID=303347 RepID=A0AAN6S3X9_9PEZI|nr:hypothetical protein QBC46DRAFT_389014 [Diplogelasinospora grovesii]